METFVLVQIVRQTKEQTREAVEAMIAGDAAKTCAALDAGGGANVEQPDTDARLARIAQHFAKLSPEERAGTLVLDPTREGRQRLTDANRTSISQTSDPQCAASGLNYISHVLPLFIYGAQHGRSACVYQI